jgi:hypothetical protein
MSQPPQPGNWPDQSWPAPQPYADQSGGVPGGVPGVGYEVAPYPYAPPGYAYGPPFAVQPTNGLAIAALICSLAGLMTCISAPVGAVLGHVARRQIRERGEAGDGMALAGIIVGWIITGLMVAYIAFVVIMFVFFASAASTYPSTYPS